MAIGKPLALCCDQLDSAISIRFTQNGFTIHPLPAVEPLAQKPASDAWLRSENRVVVKCYRNANTRKFTVLRPTKMIRNFWKTDSPEGV